MIEIKEKKDCCGCYGCENICPKNCITMVDDNEGFWYPEVDKDKCIDCNLCEKVCPVINSTNTKDNNEIKYYACKNKNLNERIFASSGGVFKILCDDIISKNGVVYGVGFDLNFNAIHKSANSIKTCKEFSGSKYMQSRIGKSYIEAKKNLIEGKHVLFSGTQCQINGLNLFLRKEYENLITVEIVCHGVPSPKVHKKYLDLKAKEYNSKIKFVNFRDKKLGWKEFSYVINFENKKEYRNTLSQDIFMKGFLKDLYLRPSCYSCNSKNFKSGADLSLADYWGVENIHPEFDDDKGTSLVLVNTKKGQEIINKISDKLEIIKTDGEFATKCNPCIVRPVKYNTKRNTFFKNFEKLDLIENIEKNIKMNLKNKFKMKIYYILLKLKNKRKNK